MPIIQITNTYKDEVLEIVKRCTPEGFEVRPLRENSKEALIECVGDADYILASGRVKIDENVIEKAQQLRMVQRTGVGLDSIDLKALSTHDIPLYVNKGINSESVAEHALLLMMACLRNLPELNSNTKNGIWNKQAQGIKTRELRNKTVGIVGMGSIGRRLAELLVPFGIRIIYSDLYSLSVDDEKKLGAEKVSYERLFRESDLISLHCPLFKETEHMIRKETIEIMKDGVIIINTARGGLICYEDLAEALLSGKIGAAGIDVYEEEPVAENNPILKCNRAITTPHIGGVTYDSFYRMMHDAMRNISLYDQGKFSLIEDFKYIF